METSTPQKSLDSRDYSRKIGIANFIDMKKAIESRKLFAQQYWTDFGRIQ